jgi:predicted nucleic acid-binding protein
MKSARPAAPMLYVAEPRPLYAERSPLVVDCSLLCALLFDEPERDEAAARLVNRRLMAPNLIDHEIVNVALKRRRAGWPQDSIELALADYSAYTIELYSTDREQQFALAERYLLSAYDAAYLWVAAELRAPLATFDRKLGDAAARHLGALD